MSLPVWTSVQHLKICKQPAQSSLSMSIVSCRVSTMISQLTTGQLCTCVSNQARITDYTLLCTGPCLCSPSLIRIWELGSAPVSCLAHGRCKLCLFLLRVALCVLQCLFILTDHAVATMWGVQCVGKDGSLHMLCATCTRMDRRGLVPMLVSTLLLLLLLLQQLLCTDAHVPLHLAAAYLPTVITQNWRLHAAVEDAGAVDYYCTRLVQLHQLISGKLLEGKQG